MINIIIRNKCLLLMAPKKAIVKSDSTIEVVTETVSKTKTKKTAELVEEPKKGKSKKTVEPIEEKVEELKKGKSKKTVEPVEEKARDYYSTFLKFKLHFRGSFVL